MNEWSPRSVTLAENEIIAISQIQNPTGRTSGEHDFFGGVITKMKNRKLTPAEAILQARSGGDERQDGHGGSIIQD